VEECHQVEEYQVEVEECHSHGGVCGFFFVYGVEHNLDDKNALCNPNI
jgi:hypothetical protein